MDYRLNSPEQMADRHYYGRGNVTVEMNPASVDAQKRIFFSPTYFDPELFKVSSRVCAYNELTTFGADRFPSFFHLDDAHNHLHQ
jgi:hypothetical protein